MASKDDEVAAGVVTSMAPREELVETAVKFLLNPKVRQSPVSQRRTFLEKKGLTHEEIDLALQRSGTGGDVAMLPPPPVPGTLMVPPPQPVSKWAQARDYAATAIVIGGVGYAMYVLYKKYVEPYLFGASEEQKRMLALQRSITELQESVAQTLKVIQEMQQTMTQQQGSITDLVRADAKSRGPDEISRIDSERAVKDIKTEIQSLKGLLLNRKQFPKTPNLGPVIPAWQLANNGGASGSPPNGASVTTTQTCETVKDEGEDGASTLNTEQPEPVKFSIDDNVHMAKVDGAHDSNTAVKVQSSADSQESTYANTKTTEESHMHGAAQAGLHVDTEVKGHSSEDSQESTDITQKMAKEDHLQNGEENGMED